MITLIINWLWQSLFTVVVDLWHRLLANNPTTATLLSNQKTQKIYPHANWCLSLPFQVKVNVIYINILWLEDKEKDTGLQKYNLF